jgi:hypothetical protein
VGWQAWLAAPVVATLIAALWVWWRARPKPAPPVHQRVRDHQRFLDDLDRTARVRTDLPQSVIAHPPDIATQGDQDKPG